MVVQSPGRAPPLARPVPPTRPGLTVEVIIKWNTLSPQLPQGTGWLAVITSDNINHYDPRPRVTYNLQHTTYNLQQTDRRTTTEKTVVSSL